MACWEERVSYRSESQHGSPTQHLLYRQLLSGRKNRALDASSISALLSSAHELDTMVSILKPLLSIALDLQEEYKQTLDPVIAKLSRGITSLPNELLHLIFEFAVRTDGHRDGGVEAGNNTFTCFTLVAESRSGES